MSPGTSGRKASPSYAASGAAEDRRRREGWAPAKPEVLPRRRTAWPAAAALGIVLIFFGVVTLWLVAIVGAALLLTAAAGWIGELRYDLAEEPDAEEPHEG
jgi:hypothetical protein